jgi:two-component system alkaline phosphatase synthesis response regulator PhoP
MAGERILVVDDEQAITDLVRAYLRHEGYTVDVATDGLMALALARKNRPALVVLDVLLPKLDGVEVCRRLRQDPITADVYIIMLTAKTEETDKLIGLAIGADDYITKPFSPRELLARIKAVLRRRRIAAEGTPLLLEYRRIRLDPDRRQTWKDGQLIELTALEFNLLHRLAASPGRVFTREQLLEQVWGYDFYGDERVVDAHIKTLRKKLEDEPANPTFIRTVRSVGYKFEDEPV